jgi:6-phosphogluconolactonase
MRRLTVILLVVSSAHCQTAAAAPHEYLAYVGTYTDHGSKGIYAYRFDSSNGKLIPLGLAAESINPSFLATDAGGNFLYAVNETETFNGQPTGAVSAFAIKRKEGKLALLNQLSSRGEDPAHIVRDHTGRYALVANYTTGSVSVFPLLKDGHLGDSTSFVQHKGSSVDPERQAGPHAHAIALSPDNRFAVVADLGLDELLVYSFDAGTGTLGVNPQVVHAAPGAGPRHLAFGLDGKFLYALNEMKSMVVTYSYDAATGVLHEVQSISALTRPATKDDTAAEIEVQPSGKFLFTSNRGDESITVFAIHPKTGTLTRIESDPTGGKTPRHFAIDPTGKWLLAENQDSNSIVVFRIDRKSGHLTRTAETAQITSPVCLAFVAGAK